MLLAVCWTRQLASLWYYNLMILIMLIGLGLIFGSFVSALVWRLHKRKNWVSERSECASCHHVLAPKDLIPVLSWVLLKGKCRYCGHSIQDSPLVELGVAAVFGLSYIFWPTSFTGEGLYQFVFWLLFLVGFAALTVYDLKWFTLPNSIVYPLIGLAVVEQIGLAALYHYSWRELAGAGIAALLMSGIFYTLFQVSRGEWIGGGDVKLAVVLGILAGDPLHATLVLFFASFLGIIMAVPQMTKGAAAAMKLKIPFGPFLIAGTVIVQLFGDPIVNWYVRLFAA